MIVNELGLVGACGLLLVYLLLVERGFKVGDGLRATRSRSCSATGLTAVFALQVFVIVGGVTRVIPLTGVTLPFVSYGGSSIVANFVLLALLLLVSDRARRPQGAAPGGGCGERARSSACSGSCSCCSRCWSAFTSRWTVFEAEALRDNPNNRRELLAGAADQARPDPRRRRRACWPAARPLPAERFGRRYPTGRAVRPRGRLHVDRPRPRGARGLLQRRADRPRDGRASTRWTRLLGPGQGGRRPAHDAAARRPRRSPPARSPARQSGGAVVAMELKTGAVKVMAAKPVLRPQRRDDCGAEPLNLATQVRYPPGSTMKVVTAAAALDSGQYKPGSQVNGEQRQGRSRARR